MDLVDKILDSFLTWLNLHVEKLDAAKAAVRKEYKEALKDRKRLRKAVRDAAPKSQAKESARKALQQANKRLKRATEKWKEMRIKHNSLAGSLK
jgi:FtsZ-binding cell division protein ZapB